MELKNFQEKAIRSLHDAMALEGVRDVVLHSPTGSGKTIVLTRFMSEYMRENPGTVFVWLTPGKGNLAEQSKEKMDLYCHNALTKLLSDAMTGGFEPGDAVFINWEKLTHENNVVLKDSERDNLYDLIKKAHDAHVTFKVVIDECHQNFKDRGENKAKAIVELFHADKIVLASATPENVSKSARVIEITEEEVIAEELIKKLIYINADIDSALKFDGNSDDSQNEYLLKLAMAKREELRMRFASKGSVVNPLVIVQLPDNDDTTLATVLKWFANNGVDVDSGNLAVWLAGRHENTDDIQKLDGKQTAIVIKQAVATGWDCPRAHVLVKLRKNMDENFEIQTIGRIRRMPEAKHYGDDLLDTCYLYTFDSKFTEGLKRELGHNAFDVKSLELKPAHRAFALVREQRSMVTDIRDEEMAFGAIFSYFKKGKLGFPLKVGDFAKNAKAMEAGEYSLSEDISGTAMSGAVAKLEEIVKSNGLSAVNYKIKLSTHAHGHLYHHSIALIGAKCELKYDETRRIIDKLFGEKNVAGKAFLNLSPKRLAAFVINNEAMLMEVFGKALSEELFAANAGSPVVEKDFRFPKKWDCTYDAVSKNSKVGAKNVYCGYPMSAGPRSTGEREFEKWCEQNQEVEWFYRNGDKGDEYFSIVYLGNAGQQKLFYPDYILSIGGKTWIIEVKGSFNKSGDSENIDRSAPKKAQALKAYCAKRGIRGGIACYDEGDGIFLLAEDGFSEDKNAECWETLDDAVAGA